MPFALEAINIKQIVYIFRQSVGLFIQSKWRLTT